MENKGGRNGKTRGKSACMVTLCSLRPTRSEMAPSCPLTPWSIHLNIVNLVIIEEMAQWLTVLVALEELGSIPSIQHGDLPQDLATFGLRTLNRQECT